MSRQSGADSFRIDIIVLSMLKWSSGTGSISTCCEDLLAGCCWNYDFDEFRGFRWNVPESSSTPLDSMSKGFRSVAWKDQKMSLSYFEDWRSSCQFAHHDHAHVQLFPLNSSQLAGLVASMLQILSYSICPVMNLQEVLEYWTTH